MEITGVEDLFRSLEAYLFLFFLFFETREV